MLERLRFGTCTLWQERNVKTFRTHVLLLQGFFQPVLNRRISRNPHVEDDDPMTQAPDQIEGTLTAGDWMAFWRTLG